MGWPENCPENWCRNVARTLVKKTGAETWPENWCRKLVQNTGAAHWCNTLVQKTGAETCCCRKLVQHKTRAAENWCSRNWCSRKLVKHWFRKLVQATGQKSGGAGIWCRHPRGFPPGKELIQE